jgi:hypothetical protein
MRSVPKLLDDTTHVVADPGQETARGSAAEPEDAWLVTSEHWPNLLRDSDAGAACPDRCNPSGPRSRRTPSPFDVAWRRSGQQGETMAAT